MIAFLAGIITFGFTTLLTIAGIASSCAILVMGLFFGDSFNYILYAQYGVAQRENEAIAFTEPTSASSIDELAGLPGVERAEPFRSVPVRLRFVGHWAPSES